MSVLLINLAAVLAHLTAEQLSVDKHPVDQKHQCGSFPNHKVIIQDLRFALMTLDWTVVENSIDHITKSNCELETVSLLANEMQSKTPERREFAVRVIGELQPVANLLRNTLEDALDDPGKEVRLRAVEALGHMGAAGGQSLDRLAGALNDPSYEVRQAAALALSKTGRGARKVTSALRIATTDSSYRVRVRAAFALWTIQDKEIVITNVLIDVLKNGEDHEKSDAALFLRYMGPDAAPAVRALQPLLGSCAFRTRRLAAQALGAIGPDAAPASRALAECLSDSEGMVASAAASALHEIGPKAIEDVIRCLEIGNRRGKAFAVQVLGHYGPKARAAIPALQKLVADDSPSMRELVIAALKQIQE